MDGLLIANLLNELPLGKQLEHNWTKFGFMFGDMWEKHPGGTVTLRVTAPGAETWHPVEFASIDYDKKIAYWDVADNELATKGYGEAQFIYWFGDEGGNGKSKIWQTCVERALTGSGTTPPSWEDIAEHMDETKAQVQILAEAVAEDKEDTEAARDEAISARDDALSAADSAAADAYTAEQARDTALQYRNETSNLKDEAVTAKNGSVTAKNESVNAALASTQAMNRAESAAQSIHGMSVVANTLEPGSPATVQWDGSIDKMTFGIPAGQPGTDGEDGQDGQDGVSPEVTITETETGHNVKITDAEHPDGQTFSVTNGVDGRDGEDGDDAPQIDDEHATTTNPWSGSKVAAEISSLNDTKVNKPAGTVQPNKYLGTDENGNTVYKDGGGGGADYTAGYGIDISANHVISVSLPNAEEGEF